MNFETLKVDRRECLEMATLKSAIRKPSTPGFGRLEAASTPKFRPLQGAAFEIFNG
jgi:hypothetical protein